MVIYCWAWPERRAQIGSSAADRLLLIVSTHASISSPDAVLNGDFMNQEQ
jgi:hypothetical protein